jgi:hypothetical protein
MSTDYNGNPTGVQAPATAPAPGVVPIVRLPTITDPFSETAHYQALKALADHVAWLMQSAIGDAFGNGSDGNLTFDGAATVLGLVPAAGVYTANKDISANNCTLSGATTNLKMNGFRLFVRGTLTTSGGAIITSDGVNCTTRATAGYGPINTIFGGLPGGQGGDGVVSAVAGSPPALTISLPGGAGHYSLGGSGGAGGASGGGTNGGTGIPAMGIAGFPPAQGNPNICNASTLGWVLGTASNAPIWSPLQGGMGGSGGGASGSGGSAGGGGTGGGILAVCARRLVLASAGNLRARGGTGSNGLATGVSGAGGGGGGGGGLLMLAYGDKAGLTFSGATNCPGGAGGTGIGTGLVGSTGGVGTVIEFPLG